MDDLDLHCGQHGTASSFTAQALYEGWREYGSKIGRAAEYILYTKTSYMFEMIQDYFRRERLVLPKSIELGNIEAIKHS